MRLHIPTVASIVSAIVSLALLLPAGQALATGDVNEASCPNENMTGFSANLPDCRAWEQVSPVEKEGGSGGVLPFDSPYAIRKYKFVNGIFYPSEMIYPFQSLADGSAITYPGEPFSRVVSRNTLLEEFLFESYTSTRAPSGWETRNGDTLVSEEAPVPIVPEVASGTNPEVLEETPDGSKVFFLDEADLIPGVSNAGASEPDLYEYDVPGKMLADLTVDKIGHADVQGILGVGGEGSEEGSYVYFVAGGILAPGASPGGCTRGAIAGEAIGTGCNLYLWHRGVTTFIATLASLDERGPALQPILRTEEEDVLDWAPSPFARTSQVSPNGRYVAFAAHDELTGQPVEREHEVSGRAGSPLVPAAEIFRYDAEAVEHHEPRLVCVSCYPAGAKVPGKAVPRPYFRTEINGADKSRYMLNDGRVLFTTTATLVPQDVNRQNDVYAWEDGAARLVSGGTSEVNPAVFATASADGSDIFFTTGQPLAPQDEDEINDVYDARENGGFPSPPPPACPVEKACPSSVALPPALGAPPVSATFSGAESAPPAAVVKPPPPLTQTQKLARALRVCHAMRSRKRRVSCESAAHKRYGPVSRPHRKMGKRSGR